MRISTNALRKSAFFLLAVLALVPQYAFAQLPVETRELKLQGTTSGSLLLKTAASTTSYTLQYPGAQGSVGSFLFLASSDGTLAWSTAAGGDNYTPVWDATANGGNGGITWVDPAGADNPNWSLTANELAANGTLGTRNGFAVNFVTNGTANTRMSISSDGVIGINDGANSGATTNIGKAAGTVNVNGTTNVTGTTNINTSNTGKTTIGNSGSTTEILGPTDINIAGAAATNIGTGASAGTVTIGRTSGTITSIGTLGHTGAANVTGTTAVNNDNNANTSINTGTSTGVVAIGGTGSTTNVLGTTNINTSGTATTTIGVANSGTTTTVALGTINVNRTGTGVTSIGSTNGATDLSGPLRMDGTYGASGTVLVSKGGSNTPQWQDINNAVGIRAAGRKETGGSLASPTAAMSVTITGVKLQLTDAIIVTMDGGGSTVVANVATRTNSTSAEAADGSFVVQLSANYAGALNYMIIKGQ